MSITAADLLVSARADITGAVKGLSDLEAAVTKSEKTLGDKGRVMGEAVGQGMTKGMSGETGRIKGVLKDMIGLGDYHAEASFTEKGAVIGGALGRGMSKGLTIALGDVGGAIDVATSLFSSSLQAIPGIGAGLSSAFHEVHEVLTSTVERGFEFNDMLHKQEVQLTLVSGSADEARRQLKELAGIAYQTDIGRGALVSTTQQLELFGMSAKKATALVSGLANASKATGHGDEGVMALGGLLSRAMELGKVDTRMVRGFVSQGLDLYGLVGQELGKSKDKAKDLIKSGALSPEDLGTILTSAFHKEKYVKAAEEMGETIEEESKKLRRLGDRNAGAGVEELYKKSVKDLEQLNDYMRGEGAGAMAANVNLMIKPVTTMMDTAIHAMASGDITGGALKAGQDIVSGLMTGIKGAAAGVVNATASLGLGVINTIQTTLDSHSDSKVMIGIGVDAGHGFEVGLMNSARRAFLNFNKLTKEQLENARKIIEVGQGMGASDKQIRAAISTGIVESKLTNLGDLGKRNDHQSHGVFQQQPFSEWGTLKQTMDVAHAATKFFEHAARMDKEGLSAGELAARVQRPRKDLRGLYGDALGAADSVISRLVGGGTALPVRIVEAAENLVGGGFTRAKQHESSIPAAKAIGDMYDESGKLLGVWHEVEKTLHDTGQIVIDIDGGFTELKTNADGLGTEIRKIPLIMSDLGSSVDASAGVAEADMEKIKAKFSGLRDNMREMGLTMKSVGGVFESSFMSAASHINEGFKSVTRNMVLSFTQAIEQMVLKAMAAKLTDALFGGTSKGESGGGGLFSKIFGSIFGAVLGGISGGLHLPGAASIGSIGSQIAAPPPPTFRASGGDVRAGSPYIVGENSPELFVPSQSGRIYNQQQIAQMGDKQPVQNHYNYTINVPLPSGQPITPQTRRQIADAAYSGISRINRTK